MRLHLIDTNQELVDAWKEQFSVFPEVQVQCGDLLEHARHCIVSPANSFGVMDGGIDAVYRQFFGPQIEQKVREHIATLPEGWLPVGVSTCIRTGHARIPYLILAPTMVMPEHVDKPNSYRAFRAVLRLAHAHPQIAEDIYCSGLASGVGMVPPHDVASMMAIAYSDSRPWPQ